MILKGHYALWYVDYASFEAHHENLKAQKMSSTASTFTQ